MNYTSILRTLGGSSLQAAVLVLLVLLVQWLFRRQLAPRWRCALWLLLVARLLLPISTSSAVSIYNLSRTAWVAKMAEASRPAAVQSLKTTEPVEVRKKFPKEVAVETASSLPDNEPTTSPSFHSAPTAAPVQFPWMQVVFGVWLGGAAVLLAQLIFLSARLARRVRGVPCTDSHVRMILAECMQQSGLRSELSVIESAAVSSPALFGIISPRLLMPIGFQQTFSAAELRYVFLHELAHLKRRDLPMNGLIAILQAIHWFNPFVWIGFARWRADRELACDALALETLGAGHQRNYGETILRLLQDTAPQPAAPGLIGISEDKWQLQQRIRQIAHFKRTPRWSALATVLLGGLAVVCLTDASAQKADAKAPLPASSSAPGSPAGQAPAAAAIPDPVPGPVHSLKLTVLDAATKQPVVGAQVMTWESRDVAKAVTDASGTATLNVPVELPFADRLQRFDATVIDPRYAPRRVMWIATAGHVRETLPTDYEIQLSAGVVAGGVVRDERGSPIAGVKVIVSGSDYKGFTLGGDTKSHQEFSAVQTEEADAPVTNEQGVWRKEHFPADLNQVTIDVLRPGGARARFVTGGGFRSPADRSTVIAMAAVKGGDIALTLKDGLTVGGIVVDEAGQPINGVQLRVREATSRNQPYALTNESDGKFELPHWDAASILVTAEHAGYRITSVTIPVTADAMPQKITLVPAKPLRLRIVGENGMPVANAEVQTDPNPSDQILAWKATTDASGRVEWATAPDAPVNIWVAPKDYPFRSVKLLADGAEHVISLRKGADKSITVHLRVVDAESGALVPNFEVWRRVANSPFKTWGDPAEKGEFSKDLASTEMPNGFVPSYRLQVRAVGYTGWNSDTLDFGNGDQDVAIKLTKGESTQANEPPPGRSPGQGISGETNPPLLILGASVGRLLEMGDVAAFVKATNASLDDWNSITPKGANLAQGPLGASPARIIQRRENAITSSATHVLELARRAGLTPGKVKFQVKSVSSPMNASSGYNIGGERVNLPYAMALRVVLAGEPTDGASDKSLRGDYELSVGNARQMPAGWRSEDGVRWTAFPPGMADEATRQELRLANMATPATFADQRTLSGSDDPSLLRFGGLVMELVRSRTITPYLTAATFSRPEMVDLYQRYDWGTEERANESFDSLASGLKITSQGLLSLQDRVGVDFSNAKLTLKQVQIERPSFTHFGELEGLRGGPVRVTFAVESSTTAKSGRSISGNYVVSIGNAVRAGNRWVMIDDKIRWQEFPKGLLTDEELKQVEFENYVAENGTLPLGQTVPEIDFVRLEDNAHTSLSAYRGKVVLLEFWATWCGPCQEPMEKLQHLRELHPDWKDRVEIIALSIDDKAVQATEHLAKKQWTSTANVWAGDGGFASAPSRAFRIRGIPTAYVIDRNGKIVRAGHPMSMEDYGVVVDAQLRQTPR